MVITSAIIAMGRSLGLRVIAVAFETKQQMHALQVSGYDDFQSYYFSRPVELKALCALPERQTQPECATRLTSDTPRSRKKTPAKKAGVRAVQVSATGGADRYRGRRYTIYAGWTGATVLPSSVAAAFIDSFKRPRSSVSKTLTRTAWPSFR